jgi:hypothetical protein
VLVADNSFMRTNLLTRIYDFFGPSISIDDLNKTYRVIDEGLFFLHLTQAYFTFKGYKQIENILED